MRAIALLEECNAATAFLGWLWQVQLLLSKNPHPSEAEIREGISGNLCRCTGYNMIVDAINLAAKKGDGLW